jgi:hypothetical protein
MVTVPILISAVAVYHLATCCNGPAPTLVPNRPHRTIPVVRSGNQALTSTTESPLEPSLVPDDEPACDAAEQSWPS